MFGEMCNLCGEMVYRVFRFMTYIVIRQTKRKSMKKGKTMTANSVLPVMWDFPVILFNIAREKVAKFVADRNDEDARWLNG
jgi:flavin reductase (DIM6/NTAB) family NADH-FMN oxidoreductase RutF